MFARELGSSADSGPLAIGEIGEQSEDREVEDGVPADSDSKKPAESPGEGFVRRRHHEFRYL